jgi:hypothetical protein
MERKTLRSVEAASLARRMFAFDLGALLGTLWGDYEQ